MKTLYYGNRNKTTEMVQEEVYALGLQVQLTTPYTKGVEPIGCLCLKCNHTWTGTPNRLLSGAGCNKCAKRINPSLEELQSELDTLGKDFKVYYPDGIYGKSTQKLTAVCNVCEFSWQSVSGVLRRPITACRACRKEKEQTEKEIKRVQTKLDFSLQMEKLKLERLSAKELKNSLNIKVPYSFETKYYSEDRPFILLGPFISQSEKIEAQCKTCLMIFRKTASNLLKGGCANCSKKLKGSIENLQDKLDKSNRNIKVSGIYTNAVGKVNCECGVCFSQWNTNPHNLDRTGCPSCARTGFDPSKSGYLYYLRVVEDQETFWKIGITNLSVKRRFRPADREKITTLYCQYFEDGKVAQDAERNILNLYKAYRAENLKILQTGNTELFTKDVLQMDHLYWGPI